MSLRILVAIIVMAEASFSAIAEISSGGSIGTRIVVAESQPKTVAVSLVMPADFVSVPVRISSELRNTAAAYEETHQALKQIMVKIKESGKFQTSMGVVSLAEHRGGYGISSGSWSQPAASAQIYLLVPFSTNVGNIFAAGVAAARFVESIALTGKAKCEVGALQLAVADPEQYRAKVLGLISEEIKRTREALAPLGGLSVAGLQSPVMVQQVDDRNVSLFLNYSLSVSK